MFARIILLLAGLSSPAQAQDVSFDGSIVEACFARTRSGMTDPDCIGIASAACQVATPGGDTTLGISQCAMAETAAWDAILNREYRAARSDFADIPGIGDLLLAAQRGWIALRDADCRIAYDRWGGGSMRNIASANCQMEHTAQRALELKHMREP